METVLRVAPLSSYLSALGLLKVIQQQLDAEVQGFWRQGRFQLVSSHSPAGLAEFLAHHYRPCPCITPWNKSKGGGKGYLDGEVPAAVAQLQGERFAELRRIAALAAQVMPPYVRSGRVEIEQKFQAIEALDRQADSDAFSAWLAICAVLTTDSKDNPIIRFPALLGGSGGYLAADFGTQFVNSLAAAQAEHFLAAIVGSTAIGLQESSGNTLIYNPAGRGDGQQGYKVATRDTLAARANPADLILAAEGMTFFQGYATTTHQDEEGRGATRQASFTLAVMHNSSLHPSSSWLENKGQRSEELWCPLWDEPCQYDAVRQALDRVAMLPLPNQLQTGTDFALFASRLGRQQNLSGFARYCFPARIGQGTKIPSLVEVFPLGETRDDRSDALAHVAAFTSILRRRSKDPSVPSSQRHSAESVVAQVEALSGGGGSFGALLRDLVAWRRQEELRSPDDQLHRFGFGRPELPPQWFQLLQSELDGPEWRLALSLGTGQLPETLQKHKATTSKDRGNDSASKPQSPGPDLHRVASGCPYASLVDVMLFLEGRLEASLVEELALGVTWIERSGLPRLPEPEQSLPWLPPDYLAGLLLNQWSFPAHSPAFKDRERWREMLLAGRPAEAMAIALQRLRLAEVIAWPWPAITHSDPQRLAQAVAVPIHRLTLQRLRQQELQRWH
ncbi:MAG: type I-U CRISPR-associated protein Csx17 [Cyanobium sp.]